jgi:hypothetical protein
MRTKMEKQELGFQELAAIHPLKSIYGGT